MDTTDISTIKISQLIENSNVNDDSVFVYNYNGQTYKINMVNLKNAIISALTDQVTQLSSDLTAEVTARQNADTGLTADISAEATARTAAITAVENAITAEATTRASADSTLTSNLATEVSNREAADTALSASIIAEETARQSADTALAADITAEATARQTADSALSTDISNEVNARQAADTALAGDITAEATARAAADTTITTNLNKVVGNIADTYDNTATYDVGDFCMYEKQLYKCNTAISTAENWNAAHWDAVKVDDELARYSYHDFAERVRIQKYGNVVNLSVGAWYNFADIIIPAEYRPNAQIYTLAEQRDANQTILGVDRIDINTNGTILPNHNNSVSFIGLFTWMIE